MIQATTILRFLAFNADAIRQICKNKSVTWLGLVFVLSAGFAREYDGEYLLAEPWHLLIPLAASLVGCLSLSFLVWLLATRSMVGTISFTTLFRNLLNAYWMTAPLAWLYAMPFERFLSPAGATTANLVLLGIVAVWRVLLIIRCIQVIFDARLPAVVATVMLFCDLLVLLALWLVPGPVFMIMGGVRLTESEDLVLGVRVWTLLIAMGTLLIWFVAYLSFLASSGRAWLFYIDGDAAQQGSHKVSRGLWMIALASIVIGCAVLPLTQPEQRLRWQSERLIRAESFDELSQLTRTHDRSRFPPHWDPPPRVGYGEWEPKIEVALVGLHRHGAADWMINAYWDKLRYQLNTRSHPMFAFAIGVDELSNEALADFADLLETTDKGKELCQSYYDPHVSHFLDLDEQRSSDQGITEERRSILLRFREIAGVNE